MLEQEQMEGLYHLEYSLIEVQGPKGKRIYFLFMNDEVHQFDQLKAAIRYGFHYYVERGDLKLYELEAYLQMVSERTLSFKMDDFARFSHLVSESIEVYQKEEHRTLFVS